VIGGRRLLRAAAGAGDIHFAQRRPTCQGESHNRERLFMIRIHGAAGTVVLFARPESRKAKLFSNGKLGRNYSMLEVGGAFRRLCRLHSSIIFNHQQIAAN